MAGQATAHKGARQGDFLAGKYLLEECLGVGGFGEVYRATNVSLDRKVAIKLLSREMTNNEDDVLRFLREARAAAAVRHPNVVDVLDVAREEDGAPFIVQELLDGEDLEQYVTTRGRLTVDEALEIMIPVADAVAAAHARDVVHRDLKPANIFLSRDGTRITPKVLDFGACMYRTLGGTVKNERSLLIGTPHYMAPEQIKRGQEVDARVDVWAMGVILWELLTGETPFEADGPDQVMKLVRTRDIPSLKSVAKRVPDELDRMVASCLSRDRNGRLPNATAVRTALEEVRNGLRGVARRSLDTLPEVVDSRPVSEPRAPKRTGRRVPSLLSLSAPDELDSPASFTGPSAKGRGDDRGLDLDLDIGAKPVSETVSSIPPVLDPRAASSPRTASSPKPPPVASVPPARTVSSRPPMSEAGASTTSPISRRPPPVSSPRTPPAVALPTPSQRRADEPLTQAEELKIAGLVVGPAFVLFIAFRFMSFLDAPLGRAMRGESSLASGILTVTTLVGAAILGVKSFASEARLKSMFVAAGASLLLGIVMIIMTFSASESAELGVAPPLAGLVPWLAPIIPIALGMPIMNRTRRVHTEAYGPDRRILIALTSLLVFFSLEVGPLGAVRSQATPPAPPTHTTP